MMERLSQWLRGGQAGNLPTAGLTYAGWTDVGCKREQNQDAWRVQVKADAPEAPLAGAVEAPGSGRLAGPGLVAVADGLGGAKSGDVASRRALELVAEGLVAGAGEVEADPSGRVQTVLRKVHQALDREAASDPALEGMGSTCSLLWWPTRDPYQAVLGQVGDSRIYRWRAGQLRQLTRDQTVVQRMIDEGKITPEGAERATFRSMLEYALGAGGGEMQAQVERVDLAAGDVLLLSSDGLHGVVNDRHLAENLARVSSRGVERVCRDLIMAARAAGGPDNITALLVQVT